MASRDRSLLIVRPSVLGLEKSTLDGLFAGSGAYADLRDVGPILTSLKPKGGKNYGAKPGFARSYAGLRTSNVKGERLRSLHRAAR